jgi:hypothetical protein
MGCNNCHGCGVEGHSSTRESMEVWRARVELAISCPACPAC